MVLFPTVCGRSIKGRSRLLLYRAEVEHCGLLWPTEFLLAHFLLCEVCRMQAVHVVGGYRWTLVWHGQHAHGMLLMMHTHNTVLQYNDLSDLS